MLIDRAPTDVKESREKVGIAYSYRIFMYPYMKGLADHSQNAATLNGRGREVGVKVGITTTVIGTIQPYR